MRKTVEKLRRRLVIVESDAIPVVTDRQLARIEKLVDRLATLRDELSEVTFELGADLEVLLGSNQPEGWRKVQAARVTAEEVA